MHITPNTPRRLAILSSICIFLAGCAVATVDVDVYKGPLAESQDVQLKELPALPMAAKCLLVQLRDQVEWPTIKQRTGVIDPVTNPWYREGFISNAESYLHKPLARRINDLLSLYDDTSDHDIAVLLDQGRSALGQYALSYEILHPTDPNQEINLWNKEIQPEFISTTTTRSNLDELSAMLKNAHQTIPAGADLTPILVAIRNLQGAYQAFLTGSVNAPSGIGNTYSIPEFPNARIEVFIFAAHKKLFDACKLVLPENTLLISKFPTTGPIFTSPLDASANERFQRLRDLPFVTAHAQLMFKANSKETVKFSSHVTAVADSFIYSREALAQIWQANVKLMALFDTPLYKNSVPHEAVVATAQAIASITQPAHLLAVIQSPPSSPGYYPDARQFLDALKVQGRITTNDILSPAFHFDAPVAVTVGSAQYDLGVPPTSPGHSPHLPPPPPPPPAFQDVVDKLAPTTVKAQPVKPAIPSPEMSVLVKNSPEQIRQDIRNRVQADLRDVLIAHPGYARGLLDADHYFPVDFLPTNSSISKDFANDQRRKYGLCRGPIFSNEIARRDLDVKQLTDWFSASTSTFINSLSGGRSQKGLESLLRDFLDQTASGNAVSAVIRQQLFDSLINFAEKIRFIANNSLLLGGDESTIKITDPHVSGGNPVEFDNSETFKPYGRLLQTIGNSIVVQVDELQKWEQQQDNNRDPHAIEREKEAVSHLLATTLPATAPATTPPSETQPYLKNNMMFQDAQTREDILREVTSMLNYSYDQAVAAYGKDSPQAKQYKDAVDAANDHFASMIYLRPASAYLRNSYPVTSLEQNNLSWQNLLEQHAWHQTPLFPTLFNAESKDQNLQNEIDKQFWQNINHIRVAGVGRTNYAIVQDDIGNWYVKGFSADPGRIFQSMQNLTLFATGGSSAGAATKLSQLIPQTTTPTAAQIAAATTQAAPNNASTAGTPQSLAQTSALYQQESFYEKQYRQQTVDQIATLIAAAKTYNNSFPNDFKTQNITNSNLSTDLTNAYDTFNATVNKAENKPDLQKDDLVTLDKKYSAVLQALQQYHDNVVKHISAETDTAPATTTKSDPAASQSALPPQFQPPDPVLFMDVSSDATTALSEARKAADKAKNAKPVAESATTKAADASEAADKALQTANSSQGSIASSHAIAAATQASNATKQAQSATQAAADATTQAASAVNSASLATQKADNFSEEAKNNYNAATQASAASTQESSASTQAAANSTQAAEAATQQATQAVTAQHLSAEQSKQDIKKLNDALKALAVARKKTIDSFESKLDLINEVAATTQP